MGEIFNTKYLNMPQQVEQNKNDIENLKRNSIKIYYCDKALSQVGNSVNVDETTFTGDNSDITPNSILIDTTGSIFKIVAYVKESGEPPELIIEFKVSLMGVPGPQGLPGEKGEKGDGFNFMGEWVPENEYYKNDVVTFNNNTTIASYVLITDQLVGSTINPEEDTTNWLPICKVDINNFTIETTHLFSGWADLFNFVTNLNSSNNPIYSAKLITSLGKDDIWGVEYEITETYSQTNPTPNITFSNSMSSSSGFYDGGEYLLCDNTDEFIGFKNYFVKNDNKSYTGGTTFYNNNKTINIISTGCYITEFLTSVEKSSMTVTKKYRARYLFNYTSNVGRFTIKVLKKI